MVKKIAIISAAARAPEAAKKGSLCGALWEVAAGSVPALQLPDDKMRFAQGKAWSTACEAKCGSVDI